MKKLMLLIFFFTVPYFFYAQSEFNKKLNELSDQLAAKLVDKGKNKIAVWDFTDLDGNVTNLGKYISENLSVDLTNAIGAIQVVDRNHLNTILKEHQLKSDGFIDPNTAIQLGKIIQVGAIVTGKITIFSSSINLTTKVLDTETADIIAATSSDLPLDDNVKELLGIPTNNPNMGFNRPLNSNENYNNPETVNKECQTNNTGDYCFKNQYNKQIKVYVSTNDAVNPSSFLMLNIGETQCYYNLNAGNYKYKVVEGNASVGYMSNWIANGNILVEKCKSKTFVIK